MRIAFVEWLQLLTFVLSYPKNPEFWSPTSRSFKPLWLKFTVTKPCVPYVIFIVDIAHFRYTGDPRIFWFHNSWSPLFRDSVLGLNFVNTSPFHDFEEKNSKNFFFGFFLKFFFSFLFIYSDCIWWILRFSC